MMPFQRPVRVMYCPAAGGADHVAQDEGSISSPASVGVWSRATWKYWLRNTEAPNCATPTAMLPRMESVVIRSSDDPRRHQRVAVATLDGDGHDEGHQRGAEELSGLNGPPREAVAGERDPDERQARGDGDEQRAPVVDADVAADVSTCRNFCSIARPARANGTATQKHQRQPRESTSRPPSSGPETVATAIVAAR